MENKTTVSRIIKRDGREVPFDRMKIAIALKKAFLATGEIDLPEDKITECCMAYAEGIEYGLHVAYEEPIDIEIVQDYVEKFLMKTHTKTAKAYILYRESRTATRERNSRLMQEYHELVHLDSKDSDVKRENANINGDTAMGTMLKFGALGAKEYYKNYMLAPEASKAHSDGNIHIHDLDFYSLTTTCTQIDIIKLFEGGFSTGHGSIREPSSIMSYAAIAAIAIQANQNDQHGGQSIPNFDHALALGVKKSLKKNFRNALISGLRMMYDIKAEPSEMKDILDDRDICIDSLRNDLFLREIEQSIASYWDIDDDKLLRCVMTAAGIAIQDTDTQTHQAMESFIHNMNTMHSRAGAQVPFSSINYGTNTTQEGRMVINNVLRATEEGMGNGETPIFPIQIFRLKKGINYDSSDPNYDLFQRACRTSARRLFPNFAFQDAPFNAKYYDPKRPETEIAYMGCRTRVVSNVYDPTREITYSRGNLSFTSINLPGIAIEAKLACGNTGSSDLGKKFYEILNTRMELVVRQLLERFKVQCSKKVLNFPFLMGQGVWLDSEKLKENDCVAEVLKHGSLSIGFIGLAECLTMLTGKHHGESEQAQNIGLAIIGHMRRYCDAKAEQYKLNFSLLATPAEGLSGRFVGIDKKRYGVIPGVTDKEYYTNSFHIPVSFPIIAYDKIKLEAPYHELTNAGHITYVEVDGDPLNNLEAFEAIVKCMAESGIGYGAINHPLDRCSNCGRSGIITGDCPKCGSEDIEHIRRITGYLVGTTERFNNAKRAEEHDRVKHI